MGCQGGMVVTSLATATRLSLHYRQWLESQKEVVEEDLKIAIWEFSTARARDDDLGQDVYLKVLKLLKLASK